jgi:hypothetical protein
MSVAASPYQVLPANMVPCVGCGVAVDKARADYTAEGEICCAGCAARNDLAATEVRAVKAMRAAGFANVGAGLLSWAFNPFFLMTISVLATAVVVTRAVNGEWYRRRMKRGRFVVSVAAITGGLIAVARLVLPFLFYAAS